MALPLVSATVIAVVLFALRYDEQIFTLEVTFSILGFFSCLV